MRMLGIALRRAVFGVGLVATGRAVLKQLRRADPELHRKRPAPAGQVHPLDTEFGVETGGFISWRALQSGGANDPYISGYHGIAPSVGRKVIGLVAHPEEFTFLDLGCGKGRATILASELPFRRVMGVEIAAPLAETARANAAVIRERFPDRPAIEIVHGDVATLELPQEKLVVFLYQPFEMPVMRKFLDRLHASLAAAPRAVIILYVYPALARLFDRDTLLERAAQGSCEVTEAERPFSYGGQGGSDAFVVWRTRQDRPAVRPG